jgi:hypothetical protein
MRATLTPLRLNELLDRLLAAARALAEYVLLASGRCFQARLTPELTGRASNADTDKLTMTSELTRAPVE